MNVIDAIEKAEMEAVAAKRAMPQFEPGDTVRVTVRVREGDRTRLQAYEGVERVFPVFSPMIEKVEVVRRGAVRRAKLYYLRERKGKSARITEATSVRAKRLNEADREAAARERSRVADEKAAAKSEAAAAAE